MSSERTSRKPRWRRNLDRLCPRGGPQRPVVSARKTGKCLRCGACCVLICLTYTKRALRYWNETRYRQRKWIREWVKAGGTKEDAKGQMDVFAFVVKHWRRVGREEAKRRGVYVAPGRFAYSCNLLQGDGSCPLHGKGKPSICTIFPGETSNVPTSCGFADRRRKPR